MDEYEKYLEYKQIINQNEQFLTSHDNEIGRSRNPKKNSLYDADNDMVNSSRQNSSISKSSSMKKNNIRYRGKRYIIKKRISEWSKSITAHGLPNIFMSKRVIIKVLWTLALFASITYCIINIYREIVKYFYYEYTTHLETVEDVPSLFPAITFCNINPLITTEAERLVEDIFKSTYNIDLSANYTLLNPLELIEKLENGKFYLSFKKINYITGHNLSFKIVFYLLIK
jgi:hypothetical protein